MRRGRQFLAKVSTLFHRVRAEQEITRDVESQLGLLEDDFQRRGMPADEARLAARRAYGGAYTVAVELVTGNFFSFFGARPALGRLIDEEDDRAEGAHPVCVLSYRVWQARFGGEPRVLGRTIRVDGVPLQVAGVVSRDFVGPELQ